MGQSLARQSLIYSGGTFLSKSLGLILIPIYIQYFSVSQYGMLAILNLILQISSFICLLGISTAAMRFYSEPGKDAIYYQRIYGNAVILILCFSPIMLCGVGVVAFLIFSKHFPSIPFFPHIILILAVSLFTPMIMLMNGFLRIQGRAKDFVIFNLAFFITQLTIILIAVIWLGTGLIGQLSSRLLATAVFWGIALTLLLKAAKLSFSWALTKDFLALGIPLVPFFISVWLYQASGPLILEMFAGLKQVGVLALASQFGGILIMLGTALDNALQPHFYKTASQPDSPQILGRLVTQYYAAFGLIGLSIIIGSPHLFVLISRPEYAESMAYVPLLVLAGFLLVAANPVTWCLTYCKQGGMLSVIRGGTAILFLILLFLFLKVFEFGVMGVIYAMIITNLSLLTIGHTVIQWGFHFHVSYKKLVLMGILFVISGITIVSFSTGLDVLSALSFQLVVFSFTAVGVVKLADAGYLFADAWLRIQRR